VLSYLSVVLFAVVADAIRSGASGSLADFHLAPLLFRSETAVAQHLRVVPIAVTFRVKRLAAASNQTFAGFFRHGCE
jgi:hypothetical protein